MSSTNCILGKAEESEPFTTADANFTLTTRLEVKNAYTSKHVALRSALWVEARFSLRAHGAAKGKNVGHLYAYIVDKTVTSGKKPVWLTEILASRDSTLTELRTVTTELYDANGAIKNPHEAWAPDIDDDKILFADTLMLAKHARGTGLSKTVMQAFHRLLPQVSNNFAYTGTIVLSPAPSSDYRDSSTKTDVEIERALMRMYGGVGYEVWIEGDEDVAGSVTVMGLVVAADDMVDSASGGTSWGFAAARMDALWEDLITSKFLAR